jgi:hypothetical protein
MTDTAVVDPTTNASTKKLFLCMCNAYDSEPRPFHRLVWAESRDKAAARFKEEFKKKFHPSVTASMPSIAEALDG